jgi:hypothetical protein
MEYHRRMPDKSPPDSAEHAEDFSHRYAQEMDYLSGDRMSDLGIPTDKIGSRIPGQGHATFIPVERTGGGSDPAGGLTIDSGMFGPELLGTLPGNKERAKGRHRDRLDADVAHEHEEARRGGNHVETLKHAPDPELPISETGGSWNRNWAAARGRLDRLAIQSTHLVWRNSGENCGHANHLRVQYDPQRIPPEVLLQ